MAVAVKRKRSANWTKDEEQQLATSLVQHQGVLSASHSTTITNHLKTDIWKTITAEINNVGGHGRTIEEVKIKSKNLKMSAKTKAMSNKQSAGKTGGGDSEEQLSSAEDTILAIVRSVDMIGVPGGIDVFDDLGTNSSDGLKKVPVTKEPREDLLGNCSSMNVYVPIASTSQTLHTAEPNLNRSSSSAAKSTDGVRKRSIFRETPTERLMREQVETTKEQLSVFKEIRDLMKEEYN